jgi:hypothetical protein
MKKRICLLGMGLLLVSMVLVSCASLQVKKTPITKSTLSSLQGRWEGWTTFSSFQANPVVTVLEINNNTVPVKGKITLNSVPEGVAALFPSNVLAPGNNVILDFNNGKISDQGTLIGTRGGDFLELTYYAGEKPRFDGWFFYEGARGTMSVNKK